MCMVLVWLFIFFPWGAWHTAGTINFVRVCTGQVWGEPKLHPLSAGQGTEASLRDAK